MPAAHVTKTADVIGCAGRAWAHDIEGFRKGYMIIRPDLKHWAYWVLLARTNVGEGAQRLKSWREGSTHSLIVMRMCTADNHDFNEYIAPGNFEMPHMYWPPKYAGEIVEVSGEDARKRLARTIDEICHGTMNPFVVNHWEHRFGPHIIENDSPPRLIGGKNMPQL
jgi:hypothetical protein